MIINDVNSDNYVYLRLKQSAKLPNGYIDLPAGTVVRFPIASLRQYIWKWEVRKNLFTREIDETTYKETDEYYYIEASPNQELATTEIMPAKQYNHVTVKRSFDIVLPVKYGDILVLNDWLESKLSENVPFIRGQMAFMDYQTVAQFNEDFFKNGVFLSNSFPSNKLAPLGIRSEVMQYQVSEEADIKSPGGGNVICKDGDAICLQFREGEEINLRDPAVSLLLLDQEYVKFLLNTEIVPEKEKANYFITDFSGWIPEAERKYYRIKDCIKIKSFNDIMNPGVWESIIRHVPDFNNIFYNNYNYSQYDDFDRDAEGYLRYVWTSGGIEIEHELSKIATPVSREIGEEHYSHEITMGELLEEERELKYRAEKYFKAHKGRYYKLQRNNPTLNPVSFMLQEEARENELKRELVKRLTKAIKARIDQN